MRNSFAVTEEEGDGGGFVACCCCEDSPCGVVVGTEKEEVEEGFVYAVFAVGAFG